MTTCDLCDLPADPPVAGEDGGVYCCRGCRAVAATLDDVADADPAEVEAATRAGRAPPDGRAARGGDGAGGGDAEVADGDAEPIPDDAETAYVAVSGMHCATCEAFLETRATRHEGVHDTTASYPSGMVRLRYDPDAVEEGALPDVLSVAGYAARPADASGGPASDEDGATTGEMADSGAGVDPVAPASTPDSTARLLVGGIFGMMVMLWYVLFLYPAYAGVPESALLLDLSGRAGAYLLGNAWLAATVVLGYTGYPLLRGAAVSLRAGYPNMDLLVALAATTAYVYSTLAVLLGRTEVYFDVSVVIVLAVSAGTAYEARVARRAASHLSEAVRERVASARRVVEGDGEDPDGGCEESVASPDSRDAAEAAAAATETVPVEALAGGDRVVVGPGERVPVDGAVVDGRAAVDASLVTGESLPERRGPGDAVVGGSAVRDGRLTVRVAPAAESTLDRLVTQLWDVQSSRSGVQRIADRLAAIFVPTVVVVAVAAALVHLGLGSRPAAAMLTGLAVLVVSCPCALGLATPLAVARGVGAALSSGVVVTDGSLVERAPDVQTVVLDKTGTLTTGEMRVLDVVVADVRADGSGSGGRGRTAATGPEDDGDAPASPDGDAPASRATVLRRAAAVEARSDHPVAAAVVDHAEEVTGTVTTAGSGVAGAGDTEAGADPSVDDFQRHPGRGVSATVDGERVVVGRPALFDESDWTVPELLAERCERARAEGAVPALVGWAGAARGCVVAGDRPRDGWRRAVAALGADRRVVVLSGDAPAAVERFRAHPAVDEALAGVPPEGKVAAVERLRGDDPVAMVGDGSNDAGALAAADVGVAMGGATALAADAADAVVVGDDLAAVSRLLALTGATRRRVRENLAWAFLYNAVAVPAAALGLVDPLVAAVAMAASSLLVVGNSRRSLGVGASDSPIERVATEDAAAEDTAPTDTP